MPQADPPSPKTTAVCAPATPTSLQHELAQYRPSQETAIDWWVYSKAYVLLKIWGGFGVIRRNCLGQGEDRVCYLYED